MTKLFLHILNWLMMSGTLMFAAGAVADVGTGGGSEAGAESAAVAMGEGADAGADNLAESGQDSGEPATASDGGTAEADSGSTDDTDAVQADADGRAIPAALKNHIAQLKAQNPELAKTIKNLYFADQALKQQFPGGVSEAVKYKGFYNEIGGEAGIEELNGYKSELEEIDRKFDSADPEFIAGIAKESPETFAKLAPQVLEHWAETDREGYNFSLARVMMNTLRQSRTIDHLSDVERALASGDIEAAKRAFAGVAEAINSFDALAQKQPERKVDPEREKFTKEKQEWEQKRSQEFQRERATRSMETFRQECSPLLDNALKPFGHSVAQLEKSDKEALSFLVTNIDQRVARKLNADQIFTRNRDSALAEMNAEKVDKLYTDAIKRFLPDAVREVVKLAYRGAKPVQQKPQQNQTGQKPNPPAGTVRLQKRPENSQIDWSRTNTDMIFAGKAYLKGKKELHVFE